MLILILFSEILTVPSGVTNLVSLTTLLGLATFVWNVKKGIKQKATKAELEKSHEELTLLIDKKADKTEIESLKILINRNYEATKELNKDIKDLLKTK